MGKSAPEPPQMPDPYALARAQGAANIETAVAQAWLNNPSRVITPYGTTYNRNTGTKYVNYVDAEGKVRKIGVPTFEQEQKLSNNQMAIVRANENASIGLGELANSQINRLSGVLNRPINTASLPSGFFNAPTSPNPTAANNLDPTLKNTYSRGNIQSSVGPADNFSADRQRVEDALMSRINPQLDRDRAAMEVKLANQGVTSGSAAWNNALDAFNRQSNDARMQAILGAGDEQSRMFGMDLSKGQFANSAQQQDYMQQQQLAQFFNQAAQQGVQNRIVAADHANQVAQANYAMDVDQMRNQQTLRQQALQEDIALRNQPIQEISALMGGAAPTIPQMQAWQGGGTIAPPPIASTVMQNAALQNQQYNQQMSQYNAGMNGMYGLGSTALQGMFFMSDRRMKKKIKRVGTLNNGLPVYSFAYKGSDAVQIGVMAQDVEKRDPGAVREFGGIKHVNYERAVA